MCESAHVDSRVFERKLEFKLNGAISDVQFKPSISLYIARNQQSGKADLNRRPLGPELAILT